MKLLKNCTDQDIKDYAKTKGYEFDNFDCEELRQPIFISDTETLEAAVMDYIYAYICPYGEDQ